MLWLKNTKLLIKKYLKGNQQLNSEYRAYRWLASRICDCHFDVEKLRPQPLPLTPECYGKVVWVYWNTGLDTAPPLVKMCYSSVLKNVGEDYQVVLLTEKNLRHYVNFPDFVYDKRSRKCFREAYFSDLLRIALLYLYGGIWIDATCLMSAPLPSYVLDSPLFMFKANLLDCHLTPIKMSSWFMKAEKGDYVMRRLLESQLVYVSKYDKLLNYYHLHLSLSALVDVDPTAKAAWERIPYVCNMNPHVLQFLWAKEYDEATFRHILSQCFIHKLTYRYQPELLTEGETMLKHTFAVFS